MSARAAVAAVVLVVLSGCRSVDAPEPDAGAAAAVPSPVASAAPTSEPAPVDVEPQDLTAADFSPGLFDDDSATIDNPWWPLPPGTRWEWRGHATEDGERVERRVVFTITDLTKRIAGVNTRVGWDRDFDGGELIEPEIIFLAQDRYGNVWHLGQYRETYDEEGEFVGGRVWVVGDPEGAEAGLLMKANPELGGSDYSQGFAPEPWNWDDRARLHRTGVRTCVPAGCFDNVLVIEEFEPSKPGASQLKFYARGVGNVRVGWLGEKEEEREVLVLHRVYELDAAALAEAREEALALEHRAYAYSRTLAATPDA